MRYRATHLSYDDGSDAMVVSEGDFTILLTNEDGYQWRDPIAHWIAVDDITEEDRVRWAGRWEENDEPDTYTSGEQYMADYLNSDSNIAYLNGH